VTTENRANDKKISELARQVMGLSRDNLLIHLRFLDAALAKLPLRERGNMGCIACDGRELFYDPVFVLKLYKVEKAALPRVYLHTLMHCIFVHSFGYDKLEGELWDLAADIAVEAVILDLQEPTLELENDEEARRKLKVLREDAGALTAEKLYRYFRKNPLSQRSRNEYRRLFYRDAHDLWRSPENLEITQEQWQQISRRIRADLKSFSKAKGKGETLEENLKEATRKRYDYSEILSRFTVMGENVAVNEDEFDYIYYTYGLRTYGNLPLVEPLEYREEKKVREFVIAIDTSASCRGKIVRNFLNKTYDILSGSENFFRKVNIHIIQCDSEIQSDTRVTNREEFEDFIKYGKLTGFGATDFRPVFDYVDKLQAQGEFENLKGLIYFTDGYGIYPPRMPDYDVIFAFLNEDPQRGPVPPWAIKVILEEEELEQDEEEKTVTESTETKQEGDEA
jgi:predicted metal-dependent peptidase